MYATSVIIKKPPKRRKFAQSGYPGIPCGTDVMNFKIFSPKNLCENVCVFAQTTVSFCKNCDHNIGF
jgi:hypothetical protein